MTTQSDEPKLRAVSYCRTSSEGQRHNTSIPRQKEGNERFIASQGWHFVRHYVDESVTGAKVGGREDFQRMMRDASNDEFEVIVPWDVTRFARDGCDIVSYAKFLKENYGVFVVDSKGQYDSRDHRRTLTNFVQAGLAEDERLRIMERCRGGVIARAKAGLPWCPKLPAGRGFKRTGKNTGEWFITEQGKKLRSLLERYVDGEPLKALAQEYGFNPAVVVRIVHGSQLSGTYTVTFNSPEIGITDLKIPVAAVPQVITPELEQRVRGRLAHNRICNKTAKRKYLLTGFVRCGCCHRALSAGQRRGGSVYAHYSNQVHRSTGRACGYWGIGGQVLEEAVLDYLYGFFLDEPAYNKAVKAALPSDDDRKALAKDITVAEKRLAALDKETRRLVKAIKTEGPMKPLLDELKRLDSERQALEIRLAELQQTRDNLPDPEEIEQEAMLLRLRLVRNHTGKDWRRLPYEEVRRFLHFLFGDNPKKNGNGIFIDGTKGAWHITFKGCVEFCHDVINGRPISHALQIMGESANKRLKAEWRLAVWKTCKESERERKRLGLPTDADTQESIKRSEQALKKLGLSLGRVKPSIDRK